MTSLANIAIHPDNDPIYVGDVKPVTIISGRNITTIATIHKMNPAITPSTEKPTDVFHLVSTKESSDGVSAFPATLSEGTDP